MLLTCNINNTPTKWFSLEVVENVSSNVWSLLLVRGIYDAKKKPVVMNTDVITGDEKKVYAERKELKEQLVAIGYK